jgi:DNA-binding transcriptional MerR regulator
VKIAGLSEASGVSVATLKYYLREGLLRPGVATAVNQAEYDESHVRRVRLIRALQDLGNLGLADIGRVLASVDDESVRLHDAFGVAQDAMVPARDRTTPGYAQAMVEVGRFVDRHRLHVRPEASVRWMLADALVALRDAGWELELTQFDDRMAAAVAEAQLELASMPPDDRVQQMEVSVIGTIAVEVAFSAMRRMALEHASWQRFGQARRPRRPNRT